MIRAAFAGVLAVAAAVGCAPPEEEPVPGDVSLEVGGAESDGLGFVPLVDGDEVTLVSGSQGGFHVWLGMEIGGMAGPAFLDRDARVVEDGALVLRAVRQGIEVPEEAMEGTWQKPTATPSFMCPSPIGVQVYDREIEIAVRVVDEDDATIAEDRVVVVPRCPDGEHHELCLELCSG